MKATKTGPLPEPTDTFVQRHIGPADADIKEMLATIGLQSLDVLIDAAVPADMRMQRPLALGRHRAEHEAMAELRGITERNEISAKHFGKSRMVHPVHAVSG